MTQSPIIEFASAAFKNDAGERLAAAAADACRENGFQFGVQIHNSASQLEIERLAGWDIPLSFHAPILTDHLINLAASDADVALQCVEETRRWAERYEVDTAVFHGFFMTDVPVPSFGRGNGFYEALNAIRRPDISVEDTDVCVDFFATEEFKIRLDRVRERLAIIRSARRPPRFLIENDCPVMTSGLSLPRYATSLGNPLCLDISHLWFAAKAYGLNFHKEIERTLDSGHVEMVHFHLSPYHQDTPLAEWSDGHKNLSTPNSMDPRRIVQACRHAGANRFVFEFNDATVKDVEIFADMWN